MKGANSMNENPKICPLLSARETPVGLQECEKDRCAWYIPAKRPKVQPEDRCAIVDIAASLDGINMDGIKILD